MEFEITVLCLVHGGLFLALSVRFSEKSTPNMHNILKAIRMTDLPWNSYVSFINHQEVIFDQIFHAINFDKSTGTEDGLSRQAGCIHVSWLWGNFSKSILGLILSNLWTVNLTFLKIAGGQGVLVAGKTQTKPILRERLGRNLWDIQLWTSLTSVPGNSLTEQSLNNKQNRLYTVSLRANHIIPV